MNKKYTYFLFLILSLPVVLFAQQENKTVVIQCTDFNITRPLRELVLDYPVDENRKYEKEESEDREHRIPQKFVYSVKDGPEYGNDPSVIQREMGTIPGRAPITNWPGQTASGFRPYDPSGAPGLNHYVQMINSTTFRVYNKVSGAILLTATLGTLWSPATPNDGDPIVMYDKTADRWFLAQFGQSGNKMYIAISTTGDPTGSYYTYTFTSPEFPDYLKFSVWPDGYYMTSNQTQKVFCFERTAMLAGNAASRAIYTLFSPPESGFFVPLPGDAADGTLPAYGTPCPIFSYSDNAWGGGNIDAVNIYQMSVNWIPSTPTGTITSAAVLPTASFDASYDVNWNDVSQPGTSQKLDGIGGVCMYRAQWKSWGGYNTVLLNWGVKISTTQRSIKWCELRQDQGTNAWSIYQEGIYTPDADTRWMGGIAMDNNGSVGLCYMKSNSTSTYPGLYYTGRRTCDPPGTLPVTESIVIAGTGYQTGTNRVGDYSHLALDPDGVTFWHTSEYMGGSSGSSAARTQIFSFQIPTCGNAAGVYISLTAGTNPQCPGASATFTATPTNGGTAPVYQWKVNGVNVGTNSTTYTTNTLTNGQVVTCVMTSNLQGVTGNPATSNAITMTVNPIVTPAVSIAITGGSNPTCTGSTVVFTASPTNGGASPSYQWKVNGANVGTNSPTYSTSTLTNGQIVSCVMTSNASCISTSTATSNSITMTVTSVVTPTVTISQTSGTNPLCSGSSATFTATVTNATNPTYQWKVDGVNVGTNSNTFTTTTLTNGQVVSCVVTSESTCSTNTVNALGTGTSTNSTTSGLGAAYPTYYGNGRQQYLVRASELTGLGFVAGNITSLGFTVAGTTGDPITLNGYTIKIAATASSTTTTTFLSPTFTTVFGPVNYTPVLNSLNTHNFTAPFYWDGTSNVLIDICFSNQVVGTVAYQTNQSSSSFVSTTYYQADGAGGAGACTQTTGSTGSIRPNMNITIGSSSINTTSNSITMTVNTSVSPSVSIALTNGSNPACVGTSLTFTATPVNGGSTPSYQWQVNGVNAGTNSPSFTTSSLTNGQTVTCILTSSATCANPLTATSNGITVTITGTAVPSLSIAITAGSNPQCPGASTTFTATPVNGGSTPSYQWKVNGSNVGSNSPTFTTSSLTNGQIVSCVMTSSLSCASPTTATSNSITMTVSSTSNLSVSIAQTAGSNPLCDGASATFTATVVNGNNPNYQWKVDGVNVGTNSNTFTTSTLTNNQVVSCEVNAAGACQISNVYTLGSGTTANTTTADFGLAYPTRYGNGRQQFLIRASELTALGFSAGDFSSLGFTTTGSAGNPVTLNGYTIKLAMTSATAMNATFQTGTFTTVFGPVNYTPVLNALNTHTFSTPFTWNGTSNILVDICFTNQVTGVSAYQTFQTASSFVSNTYYRTNNATSGAASCTRTTGTNSASMRPNMTFTMNSLGFASATSNSITMNVNPQVTASVSIALTSGTNPSCANSSLTFTATPVNGGANPSYQWQVNGVNAGTNSSTFTSSSITNGQSITCILTSNAACVNGSPDVSNAITMTINQSLNASVSIVSNQGSTICSGTSVTFTATPVNGGSTPVYQWKNGAANVGTNSNTYTTNSLANGNTISCQMTSSASCATGSPAASNNITMTVNPILPVSVTISANPGNTICSGSSVTFTASSINGGASPTYQWKNGSTLVGTNSTTYTTSAIAGGNVITCVMTSVAPCASPNPAASNAISMIVLSNVTASVSISASPGNTICSGSNVSFTASPLNGGTNPVFQWKNGGSNVGTNSPTFSSNTLSDGDLITCEMTSNANCAIDNPATSNGITMTVNPADNSIPVVTVFDNCNGTSTLTASGYTGNLSWSDGGSDNPHTVTTAGQYSVYQFTGSCQSPSSIPVTASPGSPVDDGNACTNDICNSQTGVTSHEAVSITDNDPCTIDACNSSTGTVTHTPVDVDDQNVCTIDACDSSTGRPVHTPVSADDNNVCTTDACNSVTGVYHTPVSIDDNNVCTTDACDPMTGVSHTPVSTDDNNVCTTDACDPLTGISHTPISVDDNNVCTTDACDPMTGVSHTLVSTDDDNVCTTDACNSITGISHTPISVDDNNVCTNDACDPVNGVSHTLINVDDGNACTVDDCHSVNGISHTAVNTNDNDACTTDACNTTTGAVTHTAVNTDDLNPCTIDGCDPVTGVYHQPVACGMVLNLRLYLEGFYSGGGFMHNGYNASNVVAGCLNTGFVNVSTDPNDVDSVFVTLMNSPAPHTAVDSAKGILKANGDLSVAFSNAPAGNYYIKINHRNTIETWSSSPVSLNTVSSYDFTDAAGKAFGNNQQNLGDGNFALFSGDIADAGSSLGGISGLQDGITESADYGAMESATYFALTGYVQADLTGDGIVESSDYGLLENAIYYVRVVMHP